MKLACRIVGKVIKLKGAPIPVAADGLGNAADGLLFLRGLVLAGNADGLSEHGLVAVSASDTVGARGTNSAPCTVVGPAVIASTLKSTLGVEAGLLVERDSVRAVAAAEDVSAATAVMTTVEDGEGASACGGLALSSGAVRLPVVSGGSTSNGTLGLSPLVRDYSRDAGWTPRAEGSRVVLIGTERRRRETGGSDELEAIARHVHAAVCTARRGQRRLS